MRAAARRPPSKEARIWILLWLLERARTQFLEGNFVPQSGRFMRDLRGTIYETGTIYENEAL
jgi:hypothetical protein